MIDGGNSLIKTFDNNFVFRVFRQYRNMGIQKIYNFGLKNFLSLSQCLYVGYTHRTFIRGAFQVS